MVDIAEIEKRLTGTVSSITGRDAAAISPDAQLHSLGIDSLGLVEVIVSIEKDFGLRLIEHNLSKDDFSSIRSLAAFISAKQRV